MGIGTVGVAMARVLTEGYQGWFIDAWLSMLGYEGSAVEGRSLMVAIAYCLLRAAY